MCLGQLVANIVNNSVSIIKGGVAVLDRLTDDFFDELRPEQFRRLNEEASKAGIVLPENFERRCVEALYENFLKRSGQYSKRTMIQFHSNIGVYFHWCEKKGHSTCFPCSSKLLEKYMKDKSKKVHRNTLKSHVWAISKAHRVTGYPDPYDDIYAKGTLAEIIRKKVESREAVDQARPFRLEHLQKLSEVWNIKNSLLEHRDLTLLSVAFDTLLRESELVRIRNGDITLNSDGSGTLMIPFTKTNKRGTPDYAYLSAASVALLKVQAKNVRCELGNCEVVKDKHLFIAYRRSGRPDRKALSVNAPLSSNSVDIIFKRAFQALAMKGKVWTGHSARVGSAIELHLSGEDILSLQHSGRWSTSTMPYEYTRQVRSIINKGIKGLRG